jgi:large repetitive protein
MIQIDQLTNGVELFTGNVAFPVNLVTLPGYNDMGVSVAMFYNSNVKPAAATWNLEVPTGVLGLGWSLPFEMIVAGGTSQLDRRLSLSSPNGGGPLVRTGSGPNGAQLYALEQYQFWIIRYYPQAERWEIVKENGLTYVYGDRSSGRNSVQWGIGWGNWSGASAQTSGQAPYALAWNLAEVKNLWGDSIKFTYDNDNQPVGASSI